MNEKTNIETVQEAYAAFGRGDIEGVLAALTGNVSWNMPGAPAIPFAGQRTGREGAAEFFRLLNESDEVLHFEPREFFAKGDKVVVLGVYRARARSTGKMIDSEWVHIFTLESGKVSGWTEFCDTAAIAAAYRSDSVSAR